MQYGMVLISIKNCAIKIVARNKENMLVIDYSITFNFKPSSLCARLNILININKAHSSWALYSSNKTNVRSKESKIPSAH